MVGIGGKPSLMVEEAADTWGCFGLGSHKLGLIKGGGKEGLGCYRSAR